MNKQIIWRALAAVLFGLFLLIGAGFTYAAPIMDDIFVGDEAFGSFIFDLTEMSGDLSTDPNRSFYNFSDYSSEISLSVGANEFSAPLDLEWNAWVYGSPSRQDFLQFKGQATPESFGGFLEPTEGYPPGTRDLTGHMLYNFRAPGGILQDDSFESLVQLLLLRQGGPGHFISQTEAVYSAGPWFFWAEFPYSSLQIEVTDNFVTGSFAGTITKVTDNSYIGLPEPGTLGLLLAGLAGIGFVRLRKESLISP